MKRPARRKPSPVSAARKKPRVAQELLCAQYDLARALGAARTVDEGLRLCLECALTVSGLDCGGVYLFDEANGELRLAHHRGLSARFIRSAASYPAESPNALLVTAGRPVYRVYRNLKVPKDDVRIKEGLRFIAIIPFRHEGRVIGCLNASSHARYALGAAGRRGLESVAESIGGAVSRLRAEDSLRRSREQNRQFLEATSDAVFVIDSDMKFEIVNPAGLRFLGLNKKEVAGRRIDEVFPEASSSPVFQTMRTSFRRGKSHTVSGPFDFGGRRGWFEASIDPVPGGWLCVLRDVTAAKQAERGMADNETRFKSLFETTQDSIFIIDRDTLAIVAANPAACRLYGYTEKEFKKMKNVDVSAEPKKSAAAVEKGAATVPVRYHRKKDGTVFPVEITGGYFEQNGRRLHTAFIRDISDRLNLETKLEKDRREMQTMIDTAPLRIFYKDLDGRFLRVNKAFTATLRRAEGDLIGKTVFDIYSPDIAGGMTRDDHDVFDSGKPKLGIMEQYETPSGRRWLQTDKAPIFDADGRVCGLIGIAQDITAQKAAEEVRLAGEKRFRALIENSSDAISLVGPDGSVLYASPSYERIMGYRSGERLGKSALDLVHPDDRSAIRSLLAEITARPGRIDLPPTRVRRADGSWRWIEGVAQNLFADPSVEAIVVNFRDITERREAEEALTLSEERFRLMAKNIPVLINAYGKDGTFAFWNSECERVTGYSSAEIVGNPDAAHLLYPDPIYLSRHMTEWEKRKKKFRNWEMELTCKNGEKRCVSWTNISSDRKLPGWESWAIGVDLTELKLSEKALRTSEERFRALIENSSDAIILIDPNGAVLYVSHAYERIMGYRSEERLGKTVLELIHPDDLPAIRRQLAEIIDRPERIDLPPTRVRRADGSWRWIEGMAQNLLADTSVKAIVVNFRDITERREAEEALIRSEERFRLMFQHSAGGFVIVGLDFRFRKANPAFCSMLGYTEEELQAKTFQDVTLPEDRPLGAELARATLNGEREMFNLEKRYVRTDGIVIWGLVSSALVRDRRGRPLHFVTQVLDITERREAEDALKRSEARFRDLAELLPQTIYEADIEGKLIYVNRSGFEATGYTMEDVRGGFSVFDAVVPGDRDRLREVVGRILKGEKITGTEYLALRKDGTVFPALAYSAPILENERPRGLRGMIVDISEQKKLEKDLAEARAILETAFQETPIPMVLASAPDNVFRMTNRAAIEILRAEAELDHIGQKVNDLSPSWETFDVLNNPIPLSRMPLMRALNGETTKNELYRLRRKDGSVRWEQVSAAPVRNSEGEIIAALTVFPDVTERVTAEEELTRRLEVERLAAEISAEFVNVSFDQIDAAIKLALKKTTLFAGARLGSLFVVTPDGTTVTNTHEWCASPEDSQFTMGPHPPVGIREFHLESLSRNRAVSVSRLADYPPEENGERELAEKYGFRPFALAPLFRSGELIGAVGVYGETGSEAEWPAQLVTLLGLIGDMIVNLLDRKQAETELDLYREHLEELVDQRTEELERSREAAIKLMETATAQRQRAEEALQTSTRMAEALTESQTRLRLATRSAQIGIVETDVTTGELIWDSTCADIHGLSPDTEVTLDRYLSELVAPEDREAVRSSLETALASRDEHWGSEYRIVHGDGGRSWITEDYVIIRDADGSAIRLIGAKQDVTVRKEAEEQLRRGLGEKEALIREIHHRVKNNLNTISNLIYFQAKLLKDRQAVAAFRDSQNRIQSMARIHEHLYRSWDLSTVDMNAYLSDLMVDLSQTYGVKSTRLALTVGDLALDIDQAVPCGLIMNELVSNAMKYAFEEGAKNNRIGVSLAPDGDGIVLEVSDNGRGLPENWDIYSADTLGIRLVNMFCKQLAGEITVKSRPGAGTTFRIVFKRTRGGTVS
ncbi:MAG: PAS domain S-box protein [Spirochaetales bacterium]|nr:PAS domain S-box protein [Spirochaetales bacterium]